jgi:hypothetical protein
MIQIYKEKYTNVLTTDAGQNEPIHLHCRERIMQNKIASKPAILVVVPSEVSLQPLMKTSS